MAVGKCLVIMRSLCPQKSVFYKEKKSEDQQFIERKKEFLGVVHEHVYNTMHTDRNAYICV